MTKVIRHELFYPIIKFRPSNDIALLQLAEEVDLSVHTPACLPPPGKDFTGQMGSVYGEYRVPLTDITTLTKL